MNNQSTFEETVVELNGKDNYYVIKQIIFENNVYLLANVLIGEDTPSDEITVLKVNNKDENIVLTEENDPNTLNKVMEMFSAQV